MTTIFSRVQTDAKGMALSKIDSAIQHEAPETSLNLRLAELRRELGTQLLSDEQVHPAKGLSSHWAPLDSFVVGGGWPRGELSWIEASWGCGATTLIARSMAPLTQQGQAVAWIHSDSRLRLNPAGLAASWQLQPEALLCVHTPRDTREQERRAAWAWQEILATRAFSLIVLDLRNGVSTPISDASNSGPSRSETNSGSLFSAQQQLRSDDSARGQEAFPASRKSIGRNGLSNSVSRAPLRPTEIRQLLAQARRSGAALILLTDHLADHLADRSMGLEMSATPSEELEIHTSLGSPRADKNKPVRSARALRSSSLGSSKADKNKPHTSNSSKLSALQQLHQAAALALRLERREVLITRAQHRPTPHRLERSYAHVEAFLEPVDPRLVLRPRDRNRAAPDRSARLRGVTPALLPAADVSLD